ncbi:hypothetical protein [Streptomyces sp. NPDC057910]|uniref:hypothetical protein n=1 Tax=Streptomyces sp. NPDC057910 TaxID=3346278 RepID=UPI0036EA8D6E
MKVLHYIGSGFDRFTGGWNSVERIPERDERSCLHGILEDLEEWITLDFWMCQKTLLPPSVENVHILYAALEDHNPGAQFFVRLFEKWLDGSNCFTLYEVAQRRAEIATWGNGAESERDETENFLFTSFEEFRKELEVFIPTRCPDDPAVGTYGLHFPHHVA